MEYNLIVNNMIFFTVSRLESRVRWVVMFSTYSRFGRYFYSNLYGRALRGPRDVKKSEIYFTNKTRRSNY